MFENRYSFSQKLLHRIAFSTQRLQVILAEMEDDVYRKQLATIAIEQPVFIAGLPRAGTTTLLDICVKAGGFSSHTYRHMPFLHTPLFWHTFSARFASNMEIQERAHGDGIMIGLDSPEALEEMLWKAFWPQQYQADHIDLWPNSSGEEFKVYFRQHLRKIIYLGGENGSRYVSKNNLNIARLPLLRKLFADAHLLVPFREPLQHANSLLRQHLNFSKMHDEDDFSRRYMEAIGHFDFGANLRPIAFSPTPNAYMPNTLDFWLQYWLDCYQHLLEQQPALNLLLLSYEQFSQNPTQALEQIAAKINAAHPDAFPAQADTIKPATHHNFAADSYNNELYHRCQRLYQQLEQRSIA